MLPFVDTQSFLITYSYFVHSKLRRAIQAHLKGFSKINQCLLFNQSGLLKNGPVK